MKFFKRRVKGYAITLEVIFTLMIFSIFVSMTMFTMTALDSQRYMNSILTSTLIQGAKSGGFNNSYTIINGLGDIQYTAQKEIDKLNKILGSPKIECIPDVVKPGDKVRCTIKWKYPGIVLWGAPSSGDYLSIGATEKTMSVEMDPLVLPGKLIN